MTGKQIQQLRHSLGESTEQFGRRFRVSRRTVESWENDRFKPNRWLLPAILELARSHRSEKKEKQR